MKFLTLLQGLLWLLLLCPVYSYVSGRHERRGQDCTELEPFIDPPILVVLYGDPASAICRTQHNAAMIGWEAPVGAKNALGSHSHQLVWSVSSITDWSLGRGIWCYGVFYEYGQCMANLPITIYKIPESVTLRLLNHISPLVEGEEYQLQCEVQSVAPVQNLTIIWFRGDTELEQSDFTQFTIEGDQSKDVTVKTNLSIKASREDHGALYSCAAELDLNTTEPLSDTKSNTLHLQVLYKPEISGSLHDVSLTEGDTLQLNCSDSTNPSHTYQWRHNNRTLDDKNEAQLLIESIQPDNAGVYECIVSNTLGEEASVEMVVDVQSNSKGTILGVVVVAVMVLTLGVATVIWWKCFKN